MGSSPRAGSSAPRKLGHDETTVLLRGLGLGGTPCLAAAPPLQRLREILPGIARLVGGDLLGRADGPTSGRGTRIARGGLAFAQHLLGDALGGRPFALQHDRLAAPTWPR